MNTTVIVTAAVECNGVNCPMIGKAYSYVIPLADRLVLDIYQLYDLMPLL